MSNETILAIEYDDNKRPFSIWTKDACYRVDYSETHGVLYYNDGSGLGEKKRLVVYGTGTYWALRGISVLTENSEDIVVLSTPVHVYNEDSFPIETIDDMVSLLDMHEVSGTIYCVACEDSMPDDDECVHVFQRLAGELGGSGQCYLDRDYESYKEDFLALVDRLDCPKEDMVADLEKSVIDTSLGGDLFKQSVVLTINGTGYREQVEKALTEFRDATYDGYGWLRSLEPGKTDEAIARTICWLRGEVYQPTPKALPA